MKNYTVRPAHIADKQKIADLMFFERHVHRHLDWKHPTEWLGDPYYWVIERNANIMAALACPQDKEGITWLRLFAHAEALPSNEAWQILWEKAKEDLENQGGIQVSAITLQRWMQSLLKESGFESDEKIVMLAWDGEKAPELFLPDDILIRKMTREDLVEVTELDAEAFARLWQNPLSMLEKAYSRAVIPTVAVSRDGIVGYQISTKSPFGAHLARLAVHPKLQRKGIASALISELIANLLRKGISHLSVNTQSKNKVSLSLYMKNGFVPTEEEYPLYSFFVGN